MNKGILTGKVSILLAGALILCCVLTNAAEAQKGVAFRFNPPDGLTFIETCKNTSKFSYQSVAKKPFTITTQSKITIKKKENGYHAIRVPISCKLADGCAASDFEEAMKLHMSSMVLEYMLDKDGRCLRIIGIEKLADLIVGELQKEAPPGAKINPNSAVIQQMLTDNAVDEANRWNENFAILSGRFMNTDDVVRATVPREYAGIDTKTDVMIKFAGGLKVGGKDYAKVQTSTSLEPNALNDMLSEFFTKLLAMHNLPVSIEITHSSLVDKSEFVIDPATQMPQSIANKQSIKFIGVIPGVQDMTILFEEWRQYTYDYTKI